MASDDKKTKKQLIAELDGLRRQLVSEASDKYKLLFDKVSHGFALHEVVLDENGKPVDYIFLDANHGFEESTGLKIDEIIGRKVTDVLPGIENDPADWIGRYGEVALTGKETRFEQYAEPLGRWYSVFAFSPQKGQFATIFQDVTEMKLSEVHLRESENFSKTILDNAPTGISVRDLDSTITYANPAMQNILGYSLDEIIGQKAPYPWWLSPTEERAEIVERYFREGTPSHDIVEMKNKQGEHIWVEIDIKPVIENGEVKCILSNWLDVTERKRADDALRENEAWYVNLMENAPAAVSISSQDGKITMVNKAFLEMRGFTSIDEFIGLPVEERYVAPEDRQRWLSIVAEDGYVKDFEAEVYNKDKSTLWISLNSVPLNLPNGEIRYLTISTNITERKQAEESLKQSEARYRTLIDNSPVAMTISSESGEILSVNKAFLDMAGYESLDDFRGTTLERRYVDLNDRNKWLNALSGKGKITNFEFQHRKKDGTVFWVSFSTAPLDEGSHNERLFISVMHDITEKKLAEDALSESEKELSVITDTSSDAMKLIDKDFNVVRINTALLEMFQLHGVEVVGRKCYDTAISVRCHTESCPLQEIKRTRKRYSYESEVTRMDGSKLNALVTISPVMDGTGEVVAILEDFVDITERKRAEAALLESEQNFRLSMDKAPFPIMIRLDLDRLVYANQAALDTFGFGTFEEMRDTPFKYRHPAEEYSQIVERWQKIKAGDSLPETGEREIIRQDGEVRTVLTAYSKVLWGGEEALQITLNDITERKQLEREREEIRQKAMVASRLAVTGEMAAGIAHEINNPLVGVIGYAELMMHKDIPEEMRLYVQQIYEGGNRVSEIIRRMLTFARQAKPEKRLLSVNELLENTLRIRASQMALAEIDVETRLDPYLPEILADAGQLQQVFLNIILNAEKAVKGTGRDAHFKITSEQEEGKIRISFTDNGPGIPEERLEKIFDPFFTTREVGEGTGLGLSICYGIVSEHDGTIYAMNSPDQGATFVIELPIVGKTNTQQIIREQSSATYDSPPNPDLKITVVDDEPIVQKYMKEFLTGQGYDVEIIDNGSGAVEKVIASDPDIILLDIKLPGKNGIEIYRELRKKSRALSGKVIFVTGDVMDKGTSGFLSRIKAPYVTKPFSSDEITRNIKKILANGK